MPTHNNHLVLLPLFARSHLRLSLQLTLNLLNLHPSLVATILITSVCTSRLDQEIQLQPKSVVARLEGRLRVKTVEVGLAQDAGVVQENEAFKERIGPSLEELLSGKGEDRFAPVPCLFICDVFHVFLRSALREKTAEFGIPRIPVLQLIPTMALTQHRFINRTEDFGATEKIVERLKENQAAGMEDVDAARKAFRFVDNRLLEWPDLPPMYDYEWTPQSTSRMITPMICMVQDLIWKASRDTDGSICLSTPEMDRESLERVSQIQSVPPFGVGPQFNEDVWNAAEEQERSDAVREDEKRIMAFLDESQVKYGANSSAYISFGTSFWPTLRPELITTIIISLLELEQPVPFIFATASPTGKIDEALKKRIQGSGRGLVVDWAPQVRVLRHEAVGMFLTHCGVGSLTETIVTGVPIIALPFAADQPALAAHFTQIRTIGIQLYQLSSANDNLTLGNGVHVDSTPRAMQEELRASWGQMRGPEGEEYRRNVEGVREIMRKSWEEGETRKTMLSFAQFFTEKEGA